MSLKPLIIFYLNIAMCSGKACLATIIFFLLPNSTFIMFIHYRWAWRAIAAILTIFIHNSKERLVFPKTHHTTFRFVTMARHALPLVRLKVRNARGVKVPFRENAFRPVIDRNCDTVRCGGEQREVKS